MISGTNGENGQVEGYKGSVELLRDLPKPVYLEMAGTTAAGLLDQADQFGFPYIKTARSVDVPKVIEWLHTFLATAGQEFDYDTNYRKERWLLSKYQRLEKEGTLVPREEVHELLIKMGRIIRTAGEILAKRYDNGAAEVLNNALDDVENLLAELLIDENSSPTTQKKAGKAAAKKTKTAPAS